MTEAFSNILTAFGLSTSAGLNAYVPLLIVAVLARFTDLITLSAPWDTLENPWIIGLLVVLLAIEVLADKIVGIDHINDAIQTFVRPAAGAILFAASSHTVSEVHPVLALGCGLILAFGVHAVKATARPVVSATTAGLGNPIVSTAEDVIAATVSLTAIIVPVVMIFLVLIIAWLVWRLVRRRDLSAS